MKLSVLFDQGIINHSDSFKTLFYDEKSLEYVPVAILTPYYLDMSVMRIFVRNGELFVMIEKGE